MSESPKIPPSKEETDSNSTYHDDDDVASQYFAYDQDDDVISRIKSRASISSDAKKLKEYSEKYPDGLVHLDQDSPLKPINWPLHRKVIHTLAYGLTTLTAQFGASAISPNAEWIMKDLHVGSEVATLSFCIYVLGNMVGPVFFAPFSELFGRKIGVFVPCFIGGVFMLVCANVTSIAALVVFRFFAGVFCAAPIVSSGGAMADMWAPSQRAAAMVLYAINIVAGSSTAPIFGALLSDTGTYGWRWSQWLSGLLCMVISLANGLFLAETYLPVIEQKFAKNLKLDTGVWSLHSQHDLWNLDFHEFIHIHFARPILMLMTPIITFFVFYASFVYGLVFLLITSIGVEFEKVHHFSKVPSYCPLIAIFVGFIMGGVANIFTSRRYARIAERIQARPAPEERLPAMMCLAWCLPTGMFIYGWCMKPHIHWFVSCIGLAFVGIGIAVVFQGSLVYMVDVYTKYAASAVAANTVVRSIFGGVFPLFALQMYAKMNVHWASSLLAFVALALTPVPWLFYLFGAKLRKKDPFGNKLERG